MSNRAMPETIVFPNPVPPKPGEAIEVRPGVLWARFPLPFRLDHVNVYLIEDGDGFALIDAGIDNPPSRAAWEALLAGPLRGRRLTRVIATHFHPDHVGLAGWLCERFGLQLAMSETEYLIALNIRLDPQGLKSEPYRSFYRSHGLTEESTELLLGNGLQYLRMVSAPPRTFLRLIAEDRLRIGARGDRRFRLRLRHRPAALKRQPHRLRESAAERDASTAEVVLKVVDGDARADLEFEERRPAFGVNAEIDGKEIAKADEPGEAGAEILDQRHSPPRPFVVLAAQIDHARGECGRAGGAETAASARGVPRARQSFIILHRQKGPAGVARGILDDPFYAELIGEFAAEIHEADAHVVAFDEGLDQRPVTVALPDAFRPIVRLCSIAAEAVGENADLRPERIGLDEQRTRGGRPVPERGDFLASPSMRLDRRDGEAGGGSECEAREFVLAEMRRRAGLPNRAKPSRRARAGTDEPR